VRGGTTVLQHTYDDTEPAAARNPEAVAAALSRVLQRVLDQVATELARAHPAALLPAPRTGR